MQHKPFYELPGQRYWDRYCAFYKEFHTNYHSTHGLFSLFETGELRVNHVAPRPNLRFHDKMFNVELYSTRDGYHKFITPDGKDIKNAWLFRYSTQYLLIDHDTKRAVRLSYNRNSDRFSDAPNNLRDSAAYIPRAGANPVGAPIKVSSPRPENFKEISQWCTEVVKTCETIERVAPHDGWVGHLSWNRGHCPTQTMLATNPDEFVRSLTPERIKHIALFKFGIPRKDIDYDYLLLKE